MMAGHRIDIGSTTSKEKEEELFRKITETLQIPEILEMILRFLQYPHLHVCRLVCKTWRAAASRVIRDQDMCLVNLTDHRDEYYRDNPFRHSNSTLSSLVKIIQNSSSSTFPATELSIRDGHLNNPSLKLFLDLIGLQIKTLTLTSIQMSRSSFRKLLLESMPNIENLTVDFCGCNLDEDEEELHLPKLKILSWSGPVRMVRKLLSGTPNLTTIFNFDPETIRLIIEMKKVSAIKKCRISEYINWTHVQRMAESEVKLEYLIFEIGQHSRAISNNISYKVAMESILRTSQDTLINFEMGASSFLHPEMCVPQLSALKILKIGSIPPRRCFPSSINLSFSFPNLKILDCSELTSDSDRFWDVQFPEGIPQNVLNSVRTVKIRSCTTQWMTRLRQLCPNFDSLTLRDDLSGVKNCLPGIFKTWTHLVEIQIHFKKINTVHDFELDKIFYGEDVVGMFTSVVDNNEEGQSNEGISSIQHVRGLRALRFIFLHECEEEFKLPFSQLIWVYALNVMKKRPSVSIQFDHTKLSRLATRRIYEEFSNCNINIRHQGIYGERQTDLLIPDGFRIPNFPMQWVRVV